MEWGNIDQLLLVTKLTIPAVYRDKTIPRQRLYGQLDTGVQRPILLVSAPAGFGKTTLIAEWLKQRDISAAWVSLEKADNELVRFWHYVIAALCRQQDTLRQRIETLQELSIELAPVSTPAIFNIQAILTSVLNALLELAEDVVLVLDDYQAITATAIHDSVTFFLEHLPPRLHLLMITRSDPPLALARLRVQGKLTEIRAPDLCLTVDEARSFLDQVCRGGGDPLHPRLSLTHQQIETLYMRSEGWMAGIQLAALSLNGCEDASSVQHFIDTFTGANKYILQYLSDEVLCPQPEDVQAFLLATSILERFTPALCNAVTGRSDSQELLERLERENLFLILLDEPVGVRLAPTTPAQIYYRYHSLFADFLRYRLHQQHAEQEKELHFRASIWYEQQGLMSAAIHHALLSGSSQRSVQVQPLQEYEVPLIEMLSEREYTVLRLVSEGLSNQEIAHHLFVTVSTVKTHLSNIYAKFHVHTRLQAVTKAYDLGLLSPRGGDTEGELLPYPDLSNGL